MNGVQTIFGKYFPKIVWVVKLNFKVLSSGLCGVYPALSRMQLPDAGWRMEKSMVKIWLRAWIWGDQRDIVITSPGFIITVFMSRRRWWLESERTCCCSGTVWYGAVLINLHAAGIEPCQQFFNVKRLVKYLTACFCGISKVPVTPVGGHKRTIFYFAAVLKTIFNEINSILDRHVNIWNDNVGTGIIVQAILIWRIISRTHSRIWKRVNFITQVIKDALQSSTDDVTVFKY